MRLGVSVVSTVIVLDVSLSGRVMHFAKFKFNVKERPVYFFPGDHDAANGSEYDPAIYHVFEAALAEFLSGSDSAGDS